MNPKTIQSQTGAVSPARPPCALIKPDPYASRIHRRIDMILLVITILILSLVLRASAHGQTVSTGAVPNESLRIIGDIVGTK